MANEIHEHSRRKVRLETQSEVARFVSTINRDGTTDKYVLENKDGSFVVNARSLLGVMYASSEFMGEIFLVNTNNDGKYPAGVDDFCY